MEEKELLDKIAYLEKLVADQDKYISELKEEIFEKDWKHMVDTNHDNYNKLYLSDELYRGRSILVCKNLPILTYLISKYGFERIQERVLKDCDAYYDGTLEKMYGR